MLSTEFKEDNKYVHFRINGHANLKRAPGDLDICCALVSVLAQTALYGVTEHCKEVKFSMDEGHLEFYFPKNNVISKAIAKTCFDGIEALKQDYPQCFE